MVKGERVGILKHTLSAVTVLFMLSDVVLSIFKITGEFSIFVDLWLFKLSIYLRFVIVP